MKSRSLTPLKPPSKWSLRRAKPKMALLVGYILRVHPSWMRFVEIGRTLGKPLVMRMNLNQQSSGSFLAGAQEHHALDLADSSIAACIMSTSCAR